MHINTRLLLVTALCWKTLASSGDRSDDYQNCVTSCSTNRCQIQTPIPLPLTLQITGWTCDDNCKYLCMHEKTDRDVEKGLPIQQYHGKWPFWRLAGMQEPASVVFSLFNLWSHAQGALKVQRSIPKSHPMRSYYITWAFTSINAWIWSSVFHTRDLPITEKLDYFSAALAIVYALYYTVVRLFHLYSRPNHHQSYNLQHKAWPAFCALAYGGHITYLSLLPRFDYFYNMAFNITFGLVHNALWIVYALPGTILRRFPSRPRSYRPYFVNKAVWFVVLTTAATGLELRDFPPWGRIIDAHSLWHLSTAPIAVFWYDFLIEDALDASWREQRA